MFSFRRHWHPRHYWSLETLLMSLNFWVVIGNGRYLCRTRLASEWRGFSYSNNSWCTHSLTSAGSSLCKWTQNETAGWDLTPNHFDICFGEVTGCDYSFCIWFRNFKSSFNGFVTELVIRLILNIILTWVGPLRICTKHHNWRVSTTLLSNKLGATNRKKCCPGHLFFETCHFVACR